MTMVTDMTYPLSHGTEAFRIWSLWLGHRMAEDGPAGLEAHLVQFAAMAIALDVEPAAAAVIADADLDEVTRGRAFFRVAAALDALAPSGPVGDPIAA